MTAAPPASIREPVAAGRFYPADARQLARVVDGLLAAARPISLEGELRALVVPHAGYRASGAVAASAFAVLAAGPAPHRVVLLGPAHFARIDHVAVSGADAWLTPLGTVPVDGALRHAALAAGAVANDAAHRFDHALEVELPFLQRCLGASLRILPLALGDVEPAEAARVVATVAEDALVVVSSDLSHYHDAATALRLDSRTATAICALDEGAVGDLDACGADALRALLPHARDAGWSCTRLDLRSSADAGGDPTSVVGYGAFALTSQVSTLRPGGGTFGGVVGEEGEAMAHAGDAIVIEPESTSQVARRGVIEEVLGEQPPRYRVRWEDGRTTVLSPAAGAARIEKQQK